MFNTSTIQSALGGGGHYLKVEHAVKTEHSIVIMICETKHLLS